MTASELLTALHNRGIELAVEGDKLRFRAPKGTLTPGLKSKIADLKADLLVLLQKKAASDSWNDAEAAHLVGEMLHLLNDDFPSNCILASEHWQLLDKAQSGIDTAREHHDMSALREAVGEYEQPAQDLFKMQLAGFRLGRTACKGT